MENQYYGIGRRKSAIARVSIFSTKTKIKQQETNFQVFDDFSQDQLKIIINKKKVFDYFQNDQDAIQNILQFFKIKIFDQPLTAQITVSGGGTTGQKEAICLALARAFYQMDNNLFLLNFKKKKLLTQDARVKERKKYGLKKARKAPQYSKR